MVSTDYKNKPNPKSLAHIGSKKSLAKLGVPKNEHARISKSKILNMKS